MYTVYAARVLYPDVWITLPAFISSCPQPVKHFKSFPWGDKKTMKVWTCETGGGSRSVDVSQPDTEVNSAAWKEPMGCSGAENSAQSRHGVSFNCLSGTRAADLIGPTGSPGIWELCRERGHVTSTHHQLSQISLAQLAGSGVISQFPKVPREISSPVGPVIQEDGWQIHRLIWPIRLG